MKALELPAPHGFLIWRGKQTSVGSDQPLPADEKMAVVSNGEAYGEVTLGLASAMTTAEFDRLEDDHCIRPEERKLWWNGADEFFVHRIKEFESYHKMKACRVEGGELVLLNGPEIDEECKALLVKAERLPKLIVLKENVISLEGDKIQADVDVNIRPVVEVTFDAFDLGDKALPLYHLALVKIPNMRFREKEGAMPYKKVQREGEWCVIKTTDGSTEKCYPTEEEADKLLTALNLNVEDKKKEDEVTEGDKATWTAKFVNSLPDDSFLYVEPGGDKDEDGRTVPRTLRHFPYKDADGNIDLPHLRNSLARIPQSGLSDTLKTRLTNEATAILERQNKGEKAGRRMAARMMDRLKDAWETMKDLLTWAEYDDEEMKAIGIKEVQGKYWFFAHSTNAFKDREEEIFSTKALEEYVQQAELGGADRGFFNFWHIPGSDFARKEWQGVVGRVLVEAGPFLENDLGQKALGFFKQYPSRHPDIAPEGWGCSPEYRYLPEERKSGIYQNIWITRTSTLPRMAAANIWTKGGIMALSDQQLKAAREIFGEELASQIIANAERQTKELEEAGVAHKSTEEPAKNEPVESTKVDKPTDSVETEVKAEDTTAPVEDIPEDKPAEDKPDFAEMIGKSLQPMLEGMAMMASRMDEMMGRLDALESSQKMRQATETPRWLTSVYERASQSSKTVVTEDDPLKDKKPVETAPVKKGADAYFGSRK